jgi:intein-encoded DNA endonuclease-like protein
MRNISENDENINDIMLKLINSYVKKGVNAWGLHLTLLGLKNTI